MLEQIFLFLLSPQMEPKKAVLLPPGLPERRAETVLWRWGVGWGGLGLRALQLKSAFPCQEFQSCDLFRRCERVTCALRSKDSAVVGFTSRHLWSSTDPVQ